MEKLLPKIEEVHGRAVSWPRGRDLLNYMMEDIHKLEKKALQELYRAHFQD